jgi:hypothetical protein
MHIAGPYDPETMTQTCQRCGFVLAEPRIRIEEWEKPEEVLDNPLLKDIRTHAPTRTFKAGDIVEKTPYGLALDLTRALPTCKEARF